MLARRDRRIARQKAEIASLNKKSDELSQTVKDEKALRKEAEGDRTIENLLTTKIENWKKARLEADDLRTQVCSNSNARRSS